MAIIISRYDPAIAYSNQKSFDCGHEAINGFVARSLKQQVQRNLSAAYVLTDGDTVVVETSAIIEHLAVHHPGPAPR